jgi:DNA-directed RNA polymerase II subunit RPB2
MEWKAIRSYFSTQGITRMVEHQIESYEDFIRNKLPLIVSSNAPIVVWHEQDETTKKYKYEFRLTFENITYMKPRIQEATGRVKPMFPQEARVRNFTYSAQMFCDVRFVARTYKGDTLAEYDESMRVFSGVSLGKIPVMLGSSLCILNDYPMSREETGECPNDPLGYFIIHGSERTILCQEKVADNRIMVFFNKKTASKYTYSVEMKSLHESFTTPPKKLEIRISSKFNGMGYPLTICAPRFAEDVPIMVFFRALGVETDEDIARLIWGDQVNANLDTLVASFKECADIGVYTRADAIHYLTGRLQYSTTHEDKHAYVRTLLDSEYLPHVRFGGDASNSKALDSRKCALTCAMIRRLLLTEQGRIPIDDRDAYPNKRVVTTGALLNNLFRQLFQKVSKDIRGKFVHEVNNDNWKKGESPNPLDVLNVNNLYKIIKVSTIEGKLKQALATGNFTVQGLGTSSSSMSNATKVGVSQVLNRLSYLATVSHLRRIQTPVEKSGKLLAPRKLHGTSWGYMCPVETPEGHSVGIVKSMSILTSVTQHTPSSVVVNLLRECPGIDWVDSLKPYSGTCIMLNGVIVAYTANPAKVHAYLRNAKRLFRLHPHTGIAWNILQNILTVESDGGRVVRPLFRVENGVIPSAPASDVWNDWVQSSVEYIDSSESETVRIAMTPAEVTLHHTHCEVHPTMIVGHMASSIPMSDHNQSPRNTYQSAMGKQAIGIFARNYAKRLDKNAYIFCQPARPFVETRIMNVLKTHEMPFGMNAVVAIGMYGGYNQEDSVILNKTAVDRGLFRTLYYTMYKDEEHRNVTSGKEEKFTRPQRANTRGYKTSSYHAIQDNGLPATNAIVQENDVIIGKVTNLKNDANGYAYRDSSTTHKNSEACRVDGVWQDKNSDGYPFVKVRVVSERVPEIGDKFSSRHGQKGTCGIMLNEEDMPYSASGLRPDLIMNPHAVPSRMTIAQLMETMFGKVCSMRGTLGDGTPYSHLSVAELRKHLVSLGMHPYGNELLYNGQTGEMMEAEIFMGPTFYQRLKHMVRDKTHCLTDDHDVLTTRGWKPINEVTLDDTVATLQNGNLVYAQPIRTYEYDYEGDMYEVESQQVSLKVTPSHRMWVAKSYTRKQEWRYGLHEAHTIVGKHVKYQKNVEWDVAPYQFVLPAYEDAPASEVDMEAWLVFFGIWIGDGWCTTSRVTVAANKPRVKNALDTYLPRLNLAYKYYPDSCKLDVSNRQLRNYMRALSVGATNKCLPDWVWALNKEQAKTLITGLLLSDGHTSTNKTSLLYSTASTKLADDVQRLALHAGWSANKRIHTPAGTPYAIGNHSGFTTQNLWTVAIIQSKNHPAMNHGHHKQQNGQHEGMTPFNGKVYCLEVPGNVFYVRRNGLPVWTGNSRARGPIVSLTRQPCEGRSRDGGLRVGEMERDCMLSHGVSMFTKERLMDVSDPFTTGVCKKCGTLAVMNPKENIYHCGVCGAQTDFEMKTIPYAVKLWAQELEAMHIVPRMVFE